MARGLRRRSRLWVGQFLPWRSCGDGYSSPGVPGLTQRVASQEVLIRGVTKSIRMPEWVAYSAYTSESLKVEAKQKPIDVLPRFQVVQRAVESATALLGLKGRFSAMCQVPSWWPAAHAQVDEGLRACIAFTEELIAQLHEYMGSAWG